MSGYYSVLGYINQGVNIQELVDRVDNVVNDSVISTDSAWSSANVNTKLNLHTNNTAIHAPLNDSLTTATNLWSAQKTSTDLNTKVNKTGDTVTGQLAIEGNTLIGTPQKVRILTDVVNANTRTRYVFQTENGESLVHEDRVLTGNPTTRTVLRGMSIQINPTDTSLFRFREILESDSNGFPALKVYMLDVNAERPFYTLRGKNNALGGRLVQFDSNIVHGAFCDSLDSSVLTTVLSSRVTKSANAQSVCGGFSASGTTALTSNRKWEIDSVNGNISTSAGSVSTGATFSDYGEFFENYSIGVIPYGRIVSLREKNNKYSYLDLANSDDFIGVVSATAGLKLGAAPFHWGKRYLTTIYGETITETFIDENGNEMQIPKENPDYNPENAENYLSRDQRKDEWSCVGMLGQVFVTCDNTVSLSDYITAQNGIGSFSPSQTKLRAMEYVGLDGIYSVWKCLLI